MNVENRPLQPATDAPSGNALMARAYRDLEGFASGLGTLRKAIEDLGQAGDETAEAETRRLRREIREFEPSVTMIGQVKAGKTTLVNAMVGWPDLLPADINPWTSVVTSIHLQPAPGTSASKARFRFFSEEEWSHLLSRGGRVGELASRAGADTELEKVRRQLEEMREKSRARLGQKFEMLMGQEHDYGYFDEELIQRYVCLGDDLDADAGTDEQQGRFADITKSADLYLNTPDLPMRLCIRDTPGVNDTFMIREQITVNAIRGSRLCVVVLSAHQALSTVDMAIIRLISNIKSREVIIFVNRIDELTDPGREIPEIRDSIRATLKAHDGPVDAEIIFGSAFWAGQTLGGDLKGLGRASAEALLNLAEHEINGGTDETSVDAMVWKLSGLPRLCEAIARRVVTGEGAMFEDRMARTARNIANRLTASDNVISLRMKAGPVKAVAREEIVQRLDEIARRNLDALDTGFDEVLRGLDARLHNSRRTFLTRATASLIKHLEDYGDEEVWSYEPAGLRLLLRSGYRVFAAKAAKAGEEAFGRTADEIRQLYLGVFEALDHHFTLEPPVLPRAPDPVMLGQTIVLDIRGNWWTRWWRRRRNYEAFAAEFSELIDAEVAPMAAALRTDHADLYRDAVRAALSEFIEGQRVALQQLAMQTELGIDELQDGMAAGSEERSELVNASMAVLAEFGSPREGSIA